MKAVLFLAAPIKGTMLCTIATAKAINKAK
jgi:hypothetical protein